MDVYAKLKEMGLELPGKPPAGGVYKPVKQVGNMLFVSGQGATVQGVPAICGKVGTDCTIEEGQQAARICVMNALSTLHAYLGDLNKIKSLIKILAFVESAPNFNQQPKVVDGASLLLAEIFGDDCGIGARSAIGTNELPGNITVEIEFIFEIGSIANC